MGSNPVLSRTGESLSEALILASINPKYDEKLLVELQFCTSSVHVTDKRTDVWSRNFMIWKINFGLWAVALAG